MGILNDAENVVGGGTGVRLDLYPKAVEAIKEWFLAKDKSHQTSYNWAAKWCNAHKKELGIPAHFSVTHNHVYAVCNRWRNDNGKDDRGRTGDGE